MRFPLALLPLALSVALSGCDTGGVVCPAPKATCGSACANLDADPMNCGGCGRVCSTGQACVRGLCACAGRAVACGAACVDTASDPAHCGRCETRCGAMELCDQGACAGVCGAGRTACGLSCVDPSSDPRHCGECGLSCPQGQSCAGGTCRSTVFAACFNTGELVALDDHLVQQPASGLAGGGPQSIAGSAGEVLVADTLDDALYRFDPRASPPSRAAGGDRLGKVANHLLVKGGRAYSINSGGNDVQVLDLSRPPPPAIASSRTVDQVPTAVGSPPSAANTNPGFGAFVGERLYVTLLGTCTAEGDAAGNRLLEIDFSQGAGRTARSLRFAAADYQADEGAANSPRPAGIAAVGTRLYVAIGNLLPGCLGAAGPGYLDLVETSAAELQVAHVRLPDGCRNPAQVLAGKDRIYVACPGAYGWAAEPQEALVVLDLDGKVLRTTTFPRCGPTDPFDGPAACRTAVPGRMALHGDRLLIADGNAGRLLVTDLEGRPVAGAEGGVKICPLRCADGQSGCYQYTADVFSLR